jgi:hypothetical protein
VRPGNRNVKFCSIMLTVLPNRQEGNAFDLHMGLVACSANPNNWARYS